MAKQDKPDQDRILDEINRDKTLGQRQGDLNPDAGRDVPAEGGIGQMGQRNPAEPGNQGVTHPKPGNE